MMLAFTLSAYSGRWLGGELAEYLRLSVLVATDMHQQVIRTFVFACTYLEYMSGNPRKAVLF